MSVARCACVVGARRQCGLRVHSGGVRRDGPERRARRGVEVDGNARQRRPRTGSRDGSGDRPAQHQGEVGAGVGPSFYRDHARACCDRRTGASQAGQIVIEFVHVPEAVHRANVKRANRGQVVGPVPPESVRCRVSDETPARVVDPHRYAGDGRAGSCGRDRAPDRPGCFRRRFGRASNDEAAGCDHHESARGRWLGGGRHPRRSGVRGHRARQTGRPHDDGACHQHAFQQHQHVRLHAATALLCHGVSIHPVRHCPQCSCASRSRRVRP